MLVEGLPPGLIHIELHPEQQGQGVDALEDGPWAVQKGCQVEGGVVLRGVGLVTAIDLDHRLDASVSSFGKNTKAHIRLVEVVRYPSLILELLF